MYQMVNTVAIPTDVWLVVSHLSKEVLSYGLGDIDLQYLFTWIWDSYGITLFHMCLKVDLRYINQIEVESCIGCMKSRWADDTTTTKQRATMPWGILSLYIYIYIYMCVCVYEISLPFLGDSTYIFQKVAISMNIWLWVSHHTKEVPLCSLGDIDQRYLFSWSIWQLQIL